MSALAVTSAARAEIIVGELDGSIYQTTFSTSAGGAIGESAAPGMGGFVSSTSIPTFTVPNGIPAQGSVSASASVDPFGQTLKTSVTINPASGGNAQPFGNASAYLDYYFGVHKEYDYF